MKGTNDLDILMVVILKYGKMREFLYWQFGAFTTNPK